jgi:hypothetical protein
MAHYEFQAGCPRHVQMGVAARLRLPANARVVLSCSIQIENRSFPR